MFFSKNKGPKVHDVVFMNEQACMAAVTKWLQEHQNGEVAVWFREDLEKLRHLLGDIGEGRTVLAGRLSFSHTAGRDKLFIGHYPLRSVESALYNEQDIKEALVYSHLDMPILAWFGAGRIKELMIKIGIKQEEAIEHPMITKAISNALNKISKKMASDMPASSEAEWMQLYAPES